MDCPSIVPSRWEGTATYPFASFSLNSTLSLVGSHTSKTAGIGVAGEAEHPKIQSWDTEVQPLGSFARQPTTECRLFAGL